MRGFIFFAFIGIFLVKNVTPKIQKYSTGLEWLFSTNNEQDEKKVEKKEEEEKKEEKPTVCQSEECEKIARIMSQNMDKSVDPCDNFYDYACGKWQEHNPIPEGMDSWSMMESAQINVIKQIKEIFDEGPKKSDPLAVKLAKKWYTVCMDTDKIEGYGLEQIVFTLSRIGGWPLIMEPDEWNEQEYSWQKVDDQYMRLTGRNAFHDVRVVESDSNYTQKIVHINIPHLPPRSFALLMYDEDESEEKKDESDEDPSDEEKQSGEQQDSQEPGSKDDDENDDKNDQKSDNNSNNDNENDNNDDDKNDQKDNNNDKNDDDENDGNNDDKDDDENDDEDDDEDKDEDDDDENKNKQTDDNKAKKKVSRGKKSGKFAKNKKLGHSKKIKSNAHSKKYENHKMKKQKVQRWAISTNIGEILRIHKNEKNGMKQTRRQKPKKTSEPHFSKEESNEEEYEDEQTIYAEYISKVARALAEARDVEISQEQMAKDIQDMIQFQGKLFGITVGLGENDDDSDNDDYTDDNDNDDDNDDEEKKITLNDFQEWYERKEPKTRNGAIDWTYKIAEIFDEAHVLVDGDLNIKVASPNYFRNLVALLDKTPSRTIVNYVHWNFLSRKIDTTTSEMRKLYNEWDGYEEDEEEMVLGIPKRFRKCTRDVEMSDILAYEYVRKHFSDEITATATDMMDDIQKEVEIQIKKSEWMDENTKDFILAKLVNMDKFIGYPDWYRNNTIVRRYFQGLVIGNSYYENTLSYERYSKWKGLRRLNKDENDEKEKKIMSPIMVNAFFSPGVNAVALSAADFQSPLFAYSRPQVINYGIVGTIMGHEVNHGFDNSGHLYSKSGEVVKWLAAMAEAYGKRAECFVKQFNNYTIGKNSNYKINNYGNQTAGENIADTMGLEAAFRAAQRRERECGKTDTVLPGLEDITNDQLFFLSFANLWCEYEETNSTISSAKRDVHSPGRLRVIGSVSNSEDFAKVFSCPTGSAMNPEKKCHIWK